MYPVSCKDGKDHDWITTEEDVIVCSVCYTTEHAYREAYADSTKVKKATREFADILNGIDSQFVAEDMYEEMLHTHRTLQQNFIRAIGSFVTRMSKMETDGRNEAAVEWCKKISQIDCHLPLI